MDLSQIRFDGNSPAAMMAAIGVWVVIVLTLTVAQRVLIRWLERRAASSETEVDNFLAAMLRKTRLLLIVFVAAAVASAMIVMPPRTRLIVQDVGKVALLVQLALWGGELIAVLFRRYLMKAGGIESSTTAEAIGYLARLVLWVLIVLVGLETFGIRVTALVAGLGIGGIAVALAVQNILGDVFAALSILFDKPFAVGDLIEVGTYAGTVVHVGIKSTRLRSATGELIILANGELLKSGIRNFERTGQHRSVLVTRVSPQTPDERLEEIPRIIRGIIEEQSGAIFERSHFKTIADNSYEFETVYYLRTSDYGEFLDAQQAVNLGIVRRFRDAGVTLLAQQARALAARAKHLGETAPAQLPSSRG